MKISTILLLAVLSAMAAFAALNWDLFVAPGTLSVGFAEVQAPLGLIMLGLVALLTALFLVFVVYLQASVLLDTRRHAKDLHANRELADKAEASRFTELHGFLAAELSKLATGRDEPPQMELLNRIEQLDRDLRAALSQAENSLAAQIGELEDRIERSARL